MIPIDPHNRGNFAHEHILPDLLVFSNPLAEDIPRVTYPTGLSIARFCVIVRSHSE